MITHSKQQSEKNTSNQPASVASVMSNKLGTRHLLDQCELKSGTHSQNSALDALSSKKEIPIAE